MSSDEATRPSRIDPSAGFTRVGRVIEVLIGTQGSPDHPDIVLTELLASLENADAAAFISALEVLTDHEDSHRG